MFDEARIKFNVPVKYGTSYELWGRRYPREFFDRVALSQAIDAHLKDRSDSRPIAIIGERRAGKTSILWRTAEHYKNDFLVLNVLPVYVQKARDFFLSLGVGLQSEWMPPEYIDDMQLQEQLLDRLRQHASKGKKRARPILVWIDGLDSLFENRYMEEEEKAKIMIFLLQLAEQSNFSVKLLFSMAHDFPELESVRSSPLAYKARRLILKPFPEEDARKMVKAMLEEGRDWEQEVAPFWDWERFCRETGCQPYYMKALLVHLGRVWRQHEGHIDKETWWEEAIQATIQDMTVSKAFEHIYERHFDGRERTVLLWMVRADGSLQRTSLEQVGLLLAAENLAKRFYLQEMKHRFAFRLGLLRRWLAQWPRFRDEWLRYKRITIAV